MTQDEKLIARLHSLDPGMYKVYVIVFDGKIICWIFEDGKWKVEGLITQKT
jgi:hypothetical protein